MQVPSGRASGVVNKEMFMRLVMRLFSSIFELELKTRD